MSFANSVQCFGLARVLQYSLPHASFQFKHMSYTCMNSADIPCVELAPTQIFN